MKKPLSLFLFFVLVINTNIGQRNDFDIDSIHYLSFQIQDSTAGELIRFSKMTYIDDRNRVHREWDNMDGQTELRAETDEQINDDGNIISTFTDLASSDDLDLDQSYEAKYEDGNLVEQCYFNYWVFNNQILDSQNKFFNRDFDEYGNYNTREIYVSYPGEALMLNSLELYTRVYTDGALDTVYQRNVNPTNGATVAEKKRVFNYDSDRNLLSTENFTLTEEGLDSLTLKVSYDFPVDGISSCFTVWYPNQETDDLLDSFKDRKFQNFRDEFDRIESTNIYRYDDNDDPYLVAKTIYFRSESVSSIKNIEPLDIDVTWTNHNQEELTVFLNNLQLSENYHLNIFNNNAQLISQMNILNQSDWIKEFSLPSGIYYLNVKNTKGQSLVEKIIVH